ncbi:family 2A encapsulin nanocompartment cargo protein cysteine desulfurase [Oryzomicrobium sp.]|uniref:family 2A encapsulin nanocompartment cargo protein cysteine desulfurase n=1 Tax=Oryzomicrobium sp. TaxID=1911578 RepID=UPI0025E51C75|nr:family 2A encapsulin nanocompartment cargo protein cysteine desulfurase [Oryzomicrobium sp.]MCE1242824.1 cysteine desulfurase [Oryzomicrobium sp.]
MTTPTPTSNGVAGLAAPPGLPDVATLSRLAGEFFAALPGGGASPAFAPAAPSAAAPVVEASPGVALDQPSPEPVVAGAPPRGGSAAPAVPAAYAAALPTVPLSGAPGPASPYYFVGESSAHRNAPFGLSEAALLPGGSAAPESFGLPGDAALKALLAEAGAGSSRGEAVRQEATAPGFYFLDAGGPQGQRYAAPPEAPAQIQPVRPPFDINAVRRDFPILAERVNGRPLIWFDNAATTHKPQVVIDRLAWFYAHENSNIHRAAHELAARATDAYEAARHKVARFIGAGSPEEIVFVRGATEAINLVAKTWGIQNVGAGDEILVSLLEHHANIVPWQQLAAEKGATLRVIPVDDDGQVLLDEYRKLLNGRTRLVAITQVSNALGTVTPVRQIVELAHRAGAKVLVDGAQSVSHLRTDVVALDADFFVFSGHKVFAPTGIGVVYAKKALLESMPPWQGGGNMIADVTFERTLYQPPPNKFEAGTGNIADAVGLGAALDYVERIGLEAIAQYEHLLLDYATQGLKTVPGLRLVGTARDKTSVLSFVLEGYRTEEVGTALNREGIAVRSGHHCAQPILRRFGLEATVRPSLAFYNTCEEVDTLVAVLHRLARGKGNR